MKNFFTISGDGLELDLFGAVITEGNDVPYGASDGWDAADINNLPKGALWIDNANGRLYQKIVTTNNDITDFLYFGDTSSIDTELGYIRSFIGKASGNDTPSYSSTNYITSGTDSLEDATGKLDAQIKTNADAIAAVSTSTQWSENVHAIADEAGDATAYTTWASGNPPASDTFFNTATAILYVGNGTSSPTAHITYSALADGDYRVATRDAATIYNVNVLSSTPTVSTDETLDSGDMFRVTNEETDANPAIFSWTGTVNVKIGDFSWQLADGINLTGSYSASAGDVAANDTIEVAIEKTEGTVDNIRTILGSGTQTAVSLTLTSNNFLGSTDTVKVALETIDTELKNISDATGLTITGNSVVNTVDFGTNDTTTATNIKGAVDDVITKLDELRTEITPISITSTTDTVVDSFTLTDGQHEMFEWDITVYKASSTFTYSATLKVVAAKNSTTVEQDHTVFNILKIADGDTTKAKFSADISSDDVRAKVQLPNYVSGTYTVKVARRRVYGA